MGGSERAAKQRERLIPRRGAERDAPAPELARSCAAGGLDGVLELLEDPPGAGEERRPGFGEAHLPRRALQQLGPELALEFADRDAERRLRHVQAVRGAAEVQLLANRREVVQVPMLNHRSGGERAVSAVVLGVGVGVVESVQGVSGRDLKFERHAVPLLEDRDEYAICLGAPQQRHADAVAGPLIKLADHAC